MSGVAHERMLSGDEFYEEKQPSYVKSSGKAEKCKSCIHRGVCAFSKEYEKFCNEIKEKCKLLEYQHFSACTYCGFYSEDKPITR